MLTPDRLEEYKTEMEEKHKTITLVHVPLPPGLTWEAQAGKIASLRQEGTKKS